MDVGTLHGYREAIAMLSARPAEESGAFTRTAAAGRGP